MELAVILIGLIVLGLCSGLFGALFGLGGGVIFVPILLLSGVAETATQAVAMSLVGIIAGSVGASTVLISKGLSNVRLGLMMEITTCIGAIIGAILATYLESWILMVLFSVIIIYSAFRMIINPERTVEPSDGEDGPMTFRYRDESIGEDIRYEIQNVKSGMGICTFAPHAHPDEGRQLDQQLHDRHHRVLRCDHLLLRRGLHRPCSIPAAQRRRDRVASSMRRMPRLRRVLRIPDRGPLRQKDPVEPPQEVLLDRPLRHGYPRPPPGRWCPVNAPDLNRSTATTLRVGIVIGMVLMLAGLCLYFMDGTDTLIYIGLLVLIVSPFLGVIASFVVLVIERDWRWAAVAAILFVVTAIGIVISLE